MARTRGTKPLPLPEFLLMKLHEHGFWQLDVGPHPRPWRSMKAPDLKVWVVRSNLPGSDEVVVSFGTPYGAQRLPADVAAGLIVLKLQEGSNPNRPMGLTHT
jgi:hypothetical protein